MKLISRPIRMKKWKKINQNQKRSPLIKVNIKFYSIRLLLNKYEFKPKSKRNATFQNEGIFPKLTWFNMLRSKITLFKGQSF